MLGVFVGFMVNAETAYPVVTALMFVLGYFGGLFNPVSNMPRAAGRRPGSPQFPQRLFGVGVPGRPGPGPAALVGVGRLCAAFGLAIVLKHRVEEARGLA